MPPSLLGILDIGKTHARFTTASTDEGVLTSECRAIPPPLHSAIAQELDVRGIEDWLIERIQNHPLKSQIRTLVPIAHGAAAVLIDEHLHVLIAPDYEDGRFEAVREPYRALRDPFELTYSPFLPLGLNLGRQLYYLKHRAPELMASACHILLYPQYWAWRLSGVAASEITSLGCHSDLWYPLQVCPSDLAVREGWSMLLPPVRAARDSLGTISPEMAQRTGVHSECRVLCGLHDSNASFLSHLATRRDQLFSVVSSGTWTVVMARGANLERVREGLDMLVNVDAVGAPVATARFMGGREYEVIAGPDGMQTGPSREDLGLLLSHTILALPTFSHAGGPFAGVPGRLIGADHLSARQRATLATLYVALMTDYVLSALDAQGETIIDGPLAGNALYGDLLAQLRPRNLLYVTHGAAPGAVAAACYLSGGRILGDSYRRLSGGPDVPGLEEYRVAWQSCLQQRVAT
jgi:L-fuculokinase